MFLFSFLLGNIKSQILAKHQMGNRVNRRNRADENQRKRQQKPLKNNRKIATFPFGLRRFG